MFVICSDLEGVWVPEVWINVAQKTGIEELRLTTRDEPDYNVLMRGRLEILKKHGLRLKDIQDVISTISPLDGALDAIEWVKSVTRFVLVSDTFIEFADPLMAQLNRPMLLCNSLEVNDDGFITGYKLRQKDGKKMVVQAFHSLNYKVAAFGDSYNDISMLKEADRGVLFRPPQNVINDHPQFQVISEYKEMTDIIKELKD